MKKFIIAAIAALTLIGAPTAAFAAETESAPWADTQAVAVAPTAPTPSPSGSTTGELSPTGAPATPTHASPADVSPATVPEASSTSAPMTSPSTVPASNTATDPEPSSSPSPTSPASQATGYVLAIWENAAGSPKFPQYLVSSTKTTSTDVTTALKLAATKCGTMYQSDLYADDARTAALIAKGVLNGGDESWPLNSDGTMNMRYHTITTDACPPYVPPVLNCPTDTTPGVPNEHGDNTECVSVPPTDPEGPSEPTSPSGEPSVPTTNPEVPDGTDVPSGPSSDDSSSTVKTLELSESDRPSASAAPTTSGSLAYTGSDTGDLGAWAGALLALGLFLVLGRAWSLRKR